MCFNNLQSGRAQTVDHIVCRDDLEGVAVVDALLDPPMHGIRGVVGRSHSPVVARIEATRLQDPEDLVVDGHFVPRMAYGLELVDGIEALVLDGNRHEIAVKDAAQVGQRSLALVLGTFLELVFGDVQAGDRTAELPGKGSLWTPRPLGRLVMR